MKALLVILALAGVAVASEMEPAPAAEAVAVVPAPEHVPVQVVRAEAEAVETPEMPVAPAVAATLDEVRHIPIYGLPKVEADMYERLSMRAIHDKPLFLAVRMGEKKALELFMLKNGFESIVNDPKFEFLAKDLMSGPEKVGLLHTAALEMQIPDLHYTIGDIRISSDVNPLRALQIEMDVITPWVFIIPKSELAVVPEKLFEIGTFEVRNNGIMLARDFTPAGAEPCCVGTRTQGQGLYHDLKREPVFTTGDGILKAHSMHHDQQRGLQREPVFTTEDGILKAHSMHHDLQRGLQREPVFTTEDGILKAHSLHHDLQRELSEENMKKAIMATYRASTGKPQQQLWCPMGTERWCRWRKAVADGELATFSDSSEDGILRAHSLHHDLQREPVFTTEDGILRAHSLHQDVHVPYAYRHSSPAYTPLVIRGVPSSYFTV